MAGKERDRRFMDRVFTPDERERILAAAAPTIALWKTWSAKETAFKIASKLREGLVFAHREFEVVPDDGRRARARRRRGDRALGERPLRRPRDQGPLGDGARLHPLRRATGAPRGRRLRRGVRGAAARRRVLAGIVGDGHALGGALSARRAGVGPLDGVRARPTAGAAADGPLGPAGRRDRPARGARGGGARPSSRSEGQPVAGFDVSLSHDGRFVAAVLAGPV